MHVSLLSPTTCLLKSAPYSGLNCLPLETSVTRRHRPVVALNNAECSAMAYVHIQIFTSGTLVAFASKIKYLILTNKINKEKKNHRQQRKKNNVLCLFISTVDKFIPKLSTAFLQTLPTHKNRNVNNDYLFKTGTSRNTFLLFCDV